MRLALLSLCFGWAAALSLAFFLVAVGLSIFAARASLRPLNAFAQAVSRRGPSDLRPLRRDAPPELAPLRGALNRLMDRLGQSIRRSEDFIAEAAHRVRTPLATVRAQAEIALRSAESEESRQRLRRIIRAVDESSRSAGQLLDHATVALVTLLPFESRITAVNTCVAPSAMVTLAGETVTDAIVGAPPFPGGGSVGPSPPPQAVRDTSAKTTCERRVLMGRLSSVEQVPTVILIRWRRLRRGVRAAPHRMARAG